MKYIYKNFFSATKDVAKRSTVAILCTGLVGLFAISSCDKLRNGSEGGDQTTDINEENMNVSNTIVSWATLTYGLGSYNMPCCVKTQYVYFEGDSTIATVLYKKVFSCDDKLHENIKYEGLIREQNQRTYFIPANSKTEFLLYDFSLEGGMSFEYKYWGFGGTESEIFYVNSVDSVNVNGYIKKRMQINSEYDEIVDTWIEGIGSLSGILYPCYRSFLNGGVRELLCFQNNELVYKNPEYLECYYDNAKDIIIKK